MASSINAITTGVGGIVSTGDNSGNLDLQSGGVTKIAVTSSGVAVTGTFTVNGAPAGDYNGFKNRIINGDMRIAQRSTSAVSNSAATATLAYNTIDRWGHWAEAANKFTVQQSSVAPAGFKNSVLITSSTALTTAAGNYYSFATRIEGNNIADLGFGTASAQAITISFWVRSSITGTFPCYLFNSGYSRSYTSTFTINSANTWEQKTITIAGDTSGTWLNDNTIGLEFGITLAGGSSWNNSSLNTWTSVAYGMSYTTGTTSFLATNGATLYITGVQLEKGSAATSFDVRDYGRELAMCQRYYFRQTGNGGASFVSVGGMAYSTTAGGFTVVHPVTMRSIPSSVDFSNLAATVPSTSTSSAFTGIAIATGTGESTAQITQINATGTSGLTQFRPYFLTTNVSSGYLGLNAEL